MAGGDLSLCNTSQCMHETPGGVTLPELGVVVGVLENIDVAEDVCRVSVDGNQIELPTRLEVRLRNLVGKHVVIARLSGEYHVAPRRNRAHGRGWGAR